MKGIVKFFSKERGFGFITGEDDVEYFTCTSFLDQAIVDKDDRVEFKPVKGDRGWQAKVVRLIGSEQS